MEVYLYMQRRVPAFGPVFVFSIEVEFGEGNLSININQAIISIPTR